MNLNSGAANTAWPARRPTTRGGFNRSRTAGRRPWSHHGLSAPWVVSWPAGLPRSSSWAARVLSSPVTRPRACGRWRSVSVLYSFMKPGPFWWARSICPGTSGGWCWTMSISVTAARGAFARLTGPPTAPCPVKEARPWSSNVCRTPWPTVTASIPLSKGSAAPIALFIWIPTTRSTPLNYPKPIGSLWNGPFPMPVWNRRRSRFLKPAAAVMPWKTILKLRP